LRLCPACRLLRTRRSFSGLGWLVCSCPFGIVERASVVVPHLDQDEVALFGPGQHPLPAALGLERAAAPATDGVVLHLDLRGIEQGMIGSFQPCWPRVPFFAVELPTRNRAGNARSSSWAIPVEVVRLSRIPQQIRMVGLLLLHQLQILGGRTRKHLADLRDGSACHHRKEQDVSEIVSRRRHLALAILRLFQPQDCTDRRAIGTNQLQRQCD
jgi:hypothetical protein